MNTCPLCGVKLAQVGGGWRCPRCHWSICAECDAVAEMDSIDPPVDLTPVQARIEYELFYLRATLSGAKAIKTGWGYYTCTMSRFDFLERLAFLWSYLSTAEIGSKLRVGICELIDRVDETAIEERPVGTPPPKPWTAVNEWHGRPFDDEDEEPVS